MINKGLWAALLLFPCSLMAQNFGLKLLSNWDRGGLPVVDDESYNDIWGWHDGNGKEYAIIGSLDSIYFVEISNPEQPKLRAVAAGKAQRVIHRDFKTYQQYCYAVGDEGQSSLQVFDLSYLPDSVHKVYDSDELMIRTHNIFISDEKLYLASCVDGDGNLKPMRVLSLAEPETPTLLLDLAVPDIGGIPLFDAVHDVYVRNDTAYCSVGDYGMYVFEFADSTVFTTSDSTWTIHEPSLDLLQFGVVINSGQSKYNHSSCLTDNSRHIVIAEETHGSKLRLFSLSHKRGHEQVATFGERAEEGTIAHNPFVLGDLVFVSYYHLGLIAYNISNPEAPVKVAHYDTYPDDRSFERYLGCWGVYPYLPSGNVIASDQIYGLFVFSHSLGQQKIDNRSPEISLFPSVTSGRVNVEIDDLKSGYFNVDVFDVQGRMLEQFDVKGNQVVLDLQHLRSGLYWLRIESDDFSQSKSLILR